MNQAWGRVKEKSVSNAPRTWTGVRPSTSYSAMIFRARLRGMRLRVANSCTSASILRGSKSSVLCKTQ